MKVIGISSLSAASRLYFSRLAARRQVAAVIHVLPPESGPQGLDIGVLAGKLKRFRKAPLRKIRTRLDRIARGALEVFQPRSVLDPPAAPAVEDLPFDCLPVPADQLNSPSMVATLASLAPDTIVTHEAPVLTPRVFNTAQVAALNVHYGISPEYRGEHTLFWALYHREFDKVGVTIHELDPGIDTGKVLAYGYPRLEPDDTEASIATRCTNLAPELTAEVLERLKNKPRISERQQRPGRLYRYADRTVVHELRYAIRRNLLGERLPKQEERREVKT